MSATTARALEQQPQQQPSPPQGEQQVTLKNWLAVLGAALGAFMAVLDIQITNSSLQNIQGALGATLDEGTWIATSYLVAEIITIPLTPFLSSVFSTRRYILVNACLFVFFSMCCAWAWDLNSMIIFRALQGFTGGTLIPMAMTIIMTSLPMSKRPVGMALFGVTATFAPSIGPCLGGWLTDTFSWQYIFYLNLIPGILLVAILLSTLPAKPMKLDLLKKGDWLGIVSMAIGLGCTEVVLEEGNRKDWLGSSLIVNLSSIAITALTIFIWRQFTAKTPLLNLRLLGRRNFGLGSVANVALGFGLYGSIYLIPVYLAQIQGYEALQIGETMMWLGMPQLFIIPFVPKLMKMIDPRLLVAIGIVLFATSSLMNSFMTADSSGPQMVASLLVRALGQPLIFIPLSTLTTAGIEASQTGSASALFNMMRNMGGSVGVALISTFLTRREQFHSSRLGESVVQSSLAVQDRINTLTAYFNSRGADMVTAHDQAVQMIDSIVRKQSFLMAFNDAFLIVGITLLLSVVAVAVLAKPKGQAAAGVH
jgi:DHA2 family multidrug resistance protein